MGSIRALACFLILAGAASAAPVPIPPKLADEEAPPAVARLLKHRKVQLELKLTAEQRIAIVDGFADIDEAIDKKREKILKQQNATPDVFEKLEKEHQDANAKLLKTLPGKLLTAAQRSRLKQIHRQIQGPESFTEPSLDKVLAFTDPQKSAIAKFQKNLEEKVEVYLGSLGNDESDNRKDELIKFREESLKSLVAGLAMDQREVWKSLLGEPVKGLDALELWFTLLEEADELPVR